MDDVAARFREIPVDVAPAHQLALDNDEVLPPPRYTDSAANLFGLTEHFQGLQRLGSMLVLSAGVANGDRMSHLVLLDGDARRVMGAIDLDPVLWHAGGIQLAGTLAAVPLAGDDSFVGEVRFIDLAAAAAPRELDLRIHRAHKIYAAGFAREPDGRVVVLLWDDEQLELFRSRSATLEDGFGDESAVVFPADVIGGFQGGGCGLGCGTYQSVNLLVGCGGALFIVGTRNSNKAAPAIPGDNLASLYALTWPRDEGAAATLELVERRSFTCADRQCNVAAAAGIAVLDRDRLALYAAYHWLQDDRVLLNEFAAP